MARGGKASTKIQVEGLKELLKNLRMLPKNVARKVLQQSLNKATKPVEKDMRAAAKKSDDTGALRRSIGRRAKVYARSGSAIVAVGPRSKFTRKKSRKTGQVTKKAAGWARGFVGQKNVPTLYSHLLEYGVARHTQPKLGIVHPGFPARPFVRPAWDRNKGQVRQLLQESILAGIEREAQKLAAKAA